METETKWIVKVFTVDGDLLEERETNNAYLANITVGLVMGKVIEEGKIKKGEVVEYQIWQQELNKAGRLQNE